MGNKLSRARNIQYLPRPDIREVKGDYAAFAKIDGTHPWREAVPTGFVDYPAFRRAGGRVLYFNFDLAKEIGLIGTDHAHRMNRELEKHVVDTFGIQILNEYDQLHGTKVPRGRMKPNKYMATRYLQLQHKDKTGRTSGDGRAVWNGCFEKNGVIWDFSSGGTGVTKLSPGAVAAGKPIRTGSGSYSYGSGRAGIDEGICTAIASEIIHRSGAETERVLAVIEFPGATAVNVRASKNLVRPSHLFCHLKQEKREELASAFNYFLDRQVRNARWPLARSTPKRYDDALRIIARKYAEFAAICEDQYIFCWMDWDGDNMLASGGIIDYGSIRQFGICHDRYRYDDEERWSTNLTEQKAKARGIVQSFAQLVDYLQTGQKKKLSAYRDTPALKLFDASFRRHREILLLRRIGFSRTVAEKIRTEYRREFRTFEAYYRWFETQKNNVGFRKTGDGINWYAVYAIREALVALPKHLLEHGREMDPKAFLETIRTEYASQTTMQLDNFRLRKIKGFQSAYRALLRAAAGSSSKRSFLAEIIMRTAQTNCLEPVTGDGVLYVTDRILRARRFYSREEMQNTITSFIDEKSRSFYPVPRRSHKLSARAEKLLKALLQLVHDNRFSI